MAATINERHTMNTEDNEMIQTPWGKKRWRTIREAFEQRDEMLQALTFAHAWLGDMAGTLEAAGEWGDAEQDLLECLRAAMNKAEGRIAV